VEVEKRHGVELRQSYARSGKLAPIKSALRPRPSVQARTALRKLRTCLGRVIHNIV
jgi:hypothetical protein